MGACLVDLEKAFDTVWLDGLIYKMIQKQFPEHIIKITHSMIMNRSLITYSGETSSKKSYKIKNGLQQETINSPILFNIFTSDMLNSFNLNTPENPQAIAFADNLVVYVVDSW